MPTQEDETPIEPIPIGLSRQAELGRVLGLLEERPGSITESDFDVIAMLIVDAVLDADEHSLETAERGLQHLHASNERIKRPKVEQIEERGRLLALIDIAHWGLEHVLPVSVLERLQPFEHASRFLHVIMEQRGLSSSEVIAQTNLEEHEVLHMGQLLAATGLARKRVIGRREFWEITPLGRDVVTEYRNRTLAH